jgi:chromosome segregation ATPase
MAETEENGQNGRQLVETEGFDPKDMDLLQEQRADQLYHQLGLDPVVDKVLVEFTGSLSGLDRVTDKVFGPYDIRGRAEAVAKVAALVTYSALSEQYGRELSKLESEIGALKWERDDVRRAYDGLVQKVADVVGGDYEQLKADYQELVGKLADVENLKSRLAALDQERGRLAEKVADIVGADYEDLKANYGKLVDRLAEVEHLKSEVAALTKDKERLTRQYEKQVEKLERERHEEAERLTSEMADREARIGQLESQVASLTEELERQMESNVELGETHAALRLDHEELKKAVTTLVEAVPYDDIRESLAEELYAFLLKDSKVPDVVIDGVGKFIDFRKYLGLAAEKGAREASKRAEERLRQVAGK